MTAVILNPQSGSASDLEAITAKIGAALPDARIFVGSAPGDAQRDTAAAIAGGCTTVVAAGGDGTLNDVLNGLMPHVATVRLGLLPLGTGNDFARALNFSGELDESLAAVCAGESRALDVVRVSNGKTIRHFLNLSAGGFSGVVSEKVTSDLKATWGPFSYVRGLIEALPELSPYSCELTLDGAPALLLNVFNLVIANAPYVAKGIPVAPDADPSDSWLEVIAIRETSRARLALLAPLILAGKHLESDDVFYRRAKRVAVDASPAMPFNTDGEPIGDSPWLYQILPGKLTMIVPGSVEAA